MFNPTRACELLDGLGAVNILDVEEPLPGRLEVTVESILTDRLCPNCRAEPLKRAKAMGGATLERHHIAGAQGPLAQDMLRFPRAGPRATSDARRNPSVHVEPRPDFRVAQARAPAAI